MATRSVAARAAVTADRIMDLARRSVTAATRSYSGDGRILNEEERAKETVFIHKMERERLEKLKKKTEAEKAAKEAAEKAAKEAAEKKSEQKASR